MIQTIKLSSYRIILPPRPQVRRSCRAPKVPSHADSYSKGFLALQLPSDDEEDQDWNEDDPLCNSNLNESGESSSSDEDSDDESEIDEEEVDIEDEKMDIDSDDDLFTEVKVKKSSLKNLKLSSSTKPTSHRSSSSPKNEPTS